MEAGTVTGFRWLVQLLDGAEKPKGIAHPRGGHRSLVDQKFLLRDGFDRHLRARFLVPSRVDLPRDTRTKELADIVNVLYLQGVAGHGLYLAAASTTTQILRNVPGHLATFRVHLPSTVW